MARKPKPDLNATLGRFYDGYSDPQMHVVTNFLSFLAAELSPKNALIAGAGDGMAARMMLQLLPADGSLIVIKWPGQKAEHLAPWLGSKRLDLIDHSTPLGKIDPLNLLYLHAVDNAPAEWDLLRPSMAEDAVVCVDSPPKEWWDALPYNKLATRLKGDAGFSMFLFESGRVV